MRKPRRRRPPKYLPFGVSKLQKYRPEIPELPVDWRPRPGFGPELTLVFRIGHVLMDYMLGKVVSSLKVAVLSAPTPRPTELLKDAIEDSIRAQLALVQEGRSEVIRQIARPFPS